MPGTQAGHMGELRPAQYSPVTGLIYIFNLIVGTGALTLPAAFHDAGWLLSSVILTLLAFMSYLTATFVIESMASANAIVHWERLKKLKRRGDGTVSDQLVAKSIQVQAMSTARSVETSSPLHRGSTVHQVLAQRQTFSEAIGGSGVAQADAIEVCETATSGDNTGGVSGNAEDENQPLIDRETIERLPETISSYYEITEITEMGRMAGLFFNRTGRTMFYVCLAIYLYGDLAIYGAAVSKSIRNVVCSYRPANLTSPTNISETAPCWEDHACTRMDAYRIILAIFTATIGQFVFCNVTKTKYLQILTSIMRWLAFLIMVALACINLSRQTSDRPHPPSSHVGGLPNLFGVCVYSFMCHHSLPSLVTPISRKGRLFPLILGDYLLILSFYFLLAFTGIFAFKEINDLYTLNFEPTEDDGWFLYMVHVFLSLFPVFTLSTNFPIIAITLSNNLKALFLKEGRGYSLCTRKVLFPLLALIPPTCVAMATHSLEMLVGITGSYAGAGIQYIIPAALVYYGRKESRRSLGVGVRNHHVSPFHSVYWVVFVLIWAGTCIIFVTWNHISNSL